MIPWAEVTSYTYTWNLWLHLGNELRSCKLWPSPCTHTDSGYESFCQIRNLKRKWRFWETMKTKLRKANKPQCCKNLPWMMWNEHLHIARIKQTLERISVSKPEPPSEFWLWTKPHNTVGSTKTSLAASAVPEAAVPVPLQSKGGRLGRCLSEAGTAIPCPPGSSENSKMTLHSAPHLSSMFVLPLVLLSARKQFFLHYYYILGSTAKKHWAGFAMPQWNFKERHKSEIAVSFGSGRNLTWSIQMASFCIHWTYCSLR